MNPIETLQELAQAFRSGPHVFPGGYALTLIMEDGSVFCWDCFRNTYDTIAQDMRDKYTKPMRVDVYWEGPDLYCDECGGVLESEYGDPWADDEAEITG